jgi:serine/threonine protein kinase
MGSVWLARQRSLDRLVALKFAPMREASARASNAAPKVAEGRAMARVRHPAVATIYDVFDVGGTVALSMEWCERGSLQDLLEGRPHAVAGDETAVFGSNGWLGFVLEAGITLARALAAVHEAGIVHCDVKLSNVLVRRDGSVALGDFGIARLLEDPGAEPAPLAGTRQFAAPEVQLCGITGGIDARADIDSLAVTMHGIDSTSMSWPWAPLRSAVSLRQACMSPRLRRRRGGGHDEAKNGG